MMHPAFLNFSGTISGGSSMKRLAFCGLLLICGAVPLVEAQDSKKRQELLKGLQALNEFVGVWNGDGKTTALGKPKGSWTEVLEWGWRFKGDDVWMTWKLKDGKFYKNGDLRYVPSKQGFELTLADLKGGKIVYEGKLEGQYLTLDGVDPETKATQRLKINVAGDGIRLNLVATSKRAGSTIFSADYQVGYSMEGATLGAGQKKQECIVSGGLGTGTVTYKGQTYFICCSGCRDAFNENPEFYVKQWQAKKGK
jgi:hypothetical protein